MNSIKYLDLDNDGDPDILQSTLPNGINVQWIDDDDDMKEGDLEGDLDNDCVMIDLNNHDQKGGSAANLIIQEFSDKLEEAYKSEITHLKEEIHFLRKLLEKNIGG